MCFGLKKKKAKKSKKGDKQTNTNEKVLYTNNKENETGIISEKGNKEDKTEIIIDENNENIDEIENIDNIESIENNEKNEINEINEIIDEVIVHSDESKHENLNNSFSETGHATVAGKAALKVFTTSLLAAKPFFPWIESVTTVIGEIVNQYESVEYNKKTCLVLVERIEIINLSVKSLTRRREENQEKFQKEGFYHSFIKLHKILKIVKEFIDDISELKGYRKFILAAEVKTKANNLLDRLETCCRDLQFAIIITQETKKKEQEYLDIDVANMTKFLKSIEGGVSHINAEGEKTGKVINRIYEEVAVIHKLLDDHKKEQKEQAIFNAPRINQKDLFDIEEYTSENKLYKKLLRNTIPVACKILKIPENSSPHENKKIKAQLAILNSIQSSNKIIKFHGTSQIGDNDVLVFDWAEHGNLKRLYEREKLSWVQNLQIAHDIASGLVFLQACAVLHHDIRCENILITGDARYEAKIANFHRSREQHELSEKIVSYSVIRWLAPEKMPKDLDHPSPEKYTFKCEIYSFGMLLWELCARRIPYKEKDMNHVVSHVMEKKRESFEHFNNGNNNLLEPHNNDHIIKSFTRIIEGAWAHERSQRPTINNIYQELDSLIEIHSPRVRPKSSSSDIPAHSLPENIESDSNNTFEDDDFKAFDTIMPLEEGIKAHRSGKSSEKVKAWKCFETHASLGDPTAVYWKAYYYYTGYYLAPNRPKPNTSVSVKYFGQAADAGIPEAQRFYAKALEKAKKPEYLNYYIKAADNDDVVAQRELGRIYYYGNEEVDSDKEKGIYYLKLAALKNYQNAIDDLNKIDPELLSLISISDEKLNADDKLDVLPLDNLNQ